LDFQQCKNEYDSLKLIKIIWEFIFKSDDHQEDSNMTCQEYFEKVRNVVEVNKSLGGSLADPMHLKEKLPARPNLTYTE
jgi:hypothetical protein